MDLRNVPALDGDMLKWKDYERRVTLYEMCDGGPSKTRALRLYYMLSGQAWETVSDDLDPRDLAADDGVQTFMDFLRSKFDQYEVLHMAEVMDNFFEKTKRAHGEEFRPFVNRFMKTLANLKKIGITLPDPVSAYVFWKRAARLPHAQRQHVLTSCFNKFELKSISEACCIQFPDVMHIDENIDKKREGRGVNATLRGQLPESDLDSDSALDDDDDYYEDDGTISDETPAELDYEEFEAYAAFRNAKTPRLKEARQARGYVKKEKRAAPKTVHTTSPQPSAISATTVNTSSTQLTKGQRRIQKVERSKCLSCEEVGHWMYDQECKNYNRDVKTRDASKTHTQHTLTHCKQPSSTREAAACDSVDPPQTRQSALAPPAGICQTLGLGRAHEAYVVRPASIEFNSHDLRQDASACLSTSWLLDDCSFLNEHGGKAMWDSGCGRLVAGKLWYDDDYVKRLAHLDRHHPHAISGKRVLPLRAWQETAESVRSCHTHRDPR